MMKKYFGFMALAALSCSANAGVDMKDMHKQLSIMNTIVKTSLNEVEANAGFRVNKVESLYLAGQGVVFSIDASSRMSHWSSDSFSFITLPSAPHAPHAPVVEHEVISEGEVDEIVIRTMEASTDDYEHAMVAIEQAREIARELRDQQRDVNYELRDIEREIRDKRYQEKRVDKDEKELKEIKIEIKTLEKEKKELVKQKEQLTQKNKEQEKVRKAKKIEQQKARQAYQVALGQQFASSLCGYGNSLKALPKAEKVSLVVKRGGERVNNRHLDKVYIFDKSDILQCVVEKIDAKKLISKATQYNF